VEKAAKTGDKNRCNRRPALFSLRISTSKIYIAALFFPYPQLNSLPKRQLPKKKARRSESPDLIEVGPMLKAEYKSDAAGNIRPATVSRVSEWRLGVYRKLQRNMLSAFPA
jgi:hypothetical protein